MAINNKQFGEKGKTPGYVCVQDGVDLTHYICKKVKDGARFTTLGECQYNCLGYGAPQAPPNPSLKNFGTTWNTVTSMFGMAQDSSDGQPPVFDWRKQLEAWAEEDPEPTGPIGDGEGGTIDPHLWNRCIDGMLAELNLIYYQMIQWYIDAKKEFNVPSWPGWLGPFGLLLPWEKERRMFKRMIEDMKQFIAEIEKLKVEIK